jgi:hypothetical protein
VGRGVNIDDVFFCGYNSSLWMESPGDTFKTMIAGLMRDWKPTFLRVSLGISSFTKVSWLSNPAQYRTPMVDAIRSIGAFPGTYALVLVRCDGSMIGHDEQHGNPEATGMPSDNLESKKIPSLAWDFQPFSNCAPDLVEVTRSATDLVPNDWGKVVQAYLLAHAN